MNHTLHEAWRATSFVLPCVDWGVVCHRGYILENSTKSDSINVFTV